MGTTEEQITFLAQQLSAMQTDVAQLQIALQESATTCADLMLQLVTTEPRVRMVTEAGDDATAVKSRLQALETRCTGAMKSVAQRFRGKEATAYKRRMWSGEKGSESYIAFKMELLVWVGSLHDNTIEVMDVAEAKEGRLMELNVRNAGMSQETVDDFKEMDRRLYQMHISCTKRKAKNYVCNPDRSGFKAWKQKVGHCDSRTGAARSVAFARVKHSQ